MALQSRQITFPKEYYDNGKYVQFILVIDYNDYSSIVPYNSSQYELKIMKYGNVKLQFDIDEYLLVPSEFSIKISDVKNNFEDIIFPNENANLEITGKLYINDVLEFEGIHIPEQLSYNSNREIDIVFKSNTNILNETMTVDSAGTQKDVASIGGGAKLETVIHNCYKLVNSSIDLQVNHDWDYYEESYLSEVTGSSTIYNWDDLYTSKAKFYTEDNIADCLKSLAKRKFSFTGMVNNSKAFFTHLYYYNSSNLQTLSVKAYKKGIAQPTIDYVVAKNTNGTILFELPDADTYTTVPGKYLDYQMNIWYNGSPILDYVYYNGAYHTVAIIKSDTLGTIYYHYEVALRLHYHYRNKPLYNRVDTFVVWGLDVDYLKNFNYDSCKYQILSMEKRIGEGVTVIEALFVGSTETVSVE